VGSIVLKNWTPTRTFLARKVFPITPLL
jgi:hypothetical protein